MNPSPGLRRNREKVGHRDDDASTGRKGPGGKSLVCEMGHSHSAFDHIQIAQVALCMLVSYTVRPLYTS